MLMSIKGLMQIKTHIKQDQWPNNIEWSMIPTVKWPLASMAMQMVFIEFVLVLTLMTCCLYCDKAFLKEKRTKRESLRPEVYLYPFNPHPTPEQPEPMPHPLGNNTLYPRKICCVDPDTLYNTIE